jgi:hypothetical protein
MSNIVESLSKRAHVVHYKTNVEDIPTKSEIEEILRIGYPLATSKQNAFPYQCHVLGPNLKRSENIYQMCEMNKIVFDIDTEKNYNANPYLFHVRTAPWILIWTPRLAPPNQFNKESIEETGTMWEFDDEQRHKDGKDEKSYAIEVGMIAKILTGVILDKGYDTSYTSCFPHKIKRWLKYPFIKYTPFLIQTIGKSKLYKWQNMKPENLKKDTCPPFEDIFTFRGEDE